MQKGNHQRRNLSHQICLVYEQLLSSSIARGVCIEMMKERSHRYIVFSSSFSWSQSVERIVFKGQGYIGVGVQNSRSVILILMAIILLRPAAAGAPFYSNKIADCGMCHSTSSRVGSWWRSWCSTTTKEQLLLWLINTRSFGPFQTVFQTHQRVLVKCPSGYTHVLLRPIVDKDF